MNDNKPAKNISLAAIIVITIIAALSITGCPGDEDRVVEIREVMFLTQIQDIYLNHRTFLGRTIRLEGIYMGIFWNGVYHHYVVRQTADVCCGNGSFVGFVVKWPENRSLIFPENYSWVEATGVLNLFQEDHMRYLYLELSSLNVLETRGAEFVWR